MPLSTEPHTAFCFHSINLQHSMMDDGLCMVKSFKSRQRHTRHSFINLYWTVVCCLETVCEKAKSLQIFIYQSQAWISEEISTTSRIMTFSEMADSLPAKKAMVICSILLAIYVAYVMKSEVHSEL